MNVYVITKGAYSDYHICGVSLDKEKAETIRKYCSDKWDEAQVEEYDTEEYSSDILDRSPYRVRRKKDGSATVTVIDGMTDYVFRERNMVFKDAYGGHYVQVFATDDRHALKIGIDLILQHLAEKKGL